MSNNNPHKQKMDRDILVQSLVLFSSSSSSCRLPLNALMPRLYSRSQIQAQRVEDVMRVLTGLVLAVTHTHAHTTHIATPPATSATATYSDSHSQEEEELFPQPYNDDGPSSSSSPPPPPSPPSFVGKESTLPSSSLGRFIGFTSIAINILTDKTIRRGKRGREQQKGTSSPASSSTSSPSSPSPPPFPPSSSSSSLFSSVFSSSSTERLAAGLCRMRGAALKVGQMLSIQDEGLLPTEMRQVLDRVRDAADIMPRSQLQRVLETELGHDWEHRLHSFEWSPIAAASIGQVHRAELLDRRPVVLKVQYPGVAASIHSDVDNVRRLIKLFNIVPTSLYLHQTMQQAKEELSRECDYQHEAECQQRFSSLLSTQPLLSKWFVPAVIPSLSTKQILCSEYVEGVPIDRLSIDHPMSSLSASKRNSLALDLLRLCLTELFVFRFMQTDPNWSNFLYNERQDMVYLVDFGACREYSKAFVDDYLHMVYACAERDRESVLHYSRKMGFLTGDESKAMLDAHVSAAFIVGEPFSARFESGYDFVRANMSARVAELAKTIVQLRLTPPPKDSYTLHRKLSGCFLTCRKLGASIPCRQMFLEIYQQYKFDMT